MRKTTFIAAAFAAFSLFGGGWIYVPDESGELVPRPMESTNLIMQVAQDLTTVEDLASFGGTVTNVTVDGVSVMTNKTAAISSNGRLKRLGKYIWEATTEGENYVAATNVLQQHYPVYGGCSAVHAGTLHGRTYDWYYDKCAEFVVRNPAKNGKFASIGIATSFKSLTDDFLETGKWHPSMYEIPFAWVDGMNEKGVVLQTNVTPLDETKSTAWRTYSPDKCMVFLIVRQVLDNFDNAEDAAEWIAEKLYLPPTFTFDCHIMVSDRDSCFIVEDGHIIRNTSIMPTDVMTNFRLRGVRFDDDKRPDWDTIEDYGMGVERYEDVRTNGFDKTTVYGMTETMKRLYYTRAYSKGMLPDLFWYTEYVGDHTSEGYGVLKVSDAKPVVPDTRWSKFGTYADSLITEHLDEHNHESQNYRGGHSWQTVHMCVYDQQNLVMRIWTQEDDASAMMFTLKKNPADFKVDMYKDYADETVTNGILVAAKEYTNNYTNQAPNYANVSNLAENALQRSETGDVIKVAIDYTNNYTNQAPNYNTVSNHAENALQRSETNDVIKVSEDFTDSSLTNKDVSAFGTSYLADSIVGKLSNTGIRLEVDNGQLSVVDKETVKWSLNKNTDIPSTNGLINVEEASNIVDKAIGQFANVSVGTGAIIRVTNSVTHVVGDVQDYKVKIGENAVADAIDTQDIAIGRDAQAHGSASMAVGPNAEADRNYGLSIGWRNAACGIGSIAIGMGYKSSTEFWLDSEKTVRNPEADYTAAVGDHSIAIGRSAITESENAIAIGERACVKANSNGAIQLGTGTNSTPNSLQFQGVVIVSDGKIQAGYTKPKKVDPEEIEQEEYNIYLDPGNKYTVLPNDQLGPGSEMSIIPKIDDRNYDIFFPNEPNVAAGLPIEVKFNVPSNVKIVNRSNSTILKLPMKLMFEQPYERCIVVTTDVMDDGTDWTPVITENNFSWDFDAGEFKTATGSTGCLVGTNLHAAISFKIAYPIDAAGNTVTNDVATIDAGQTFISSTFYNYVEPMTYKPTGTGPYFIDDASWFEIIYKTNFGTANVIRKPIVIE